MTVGFFPAFEPKIVVAYDGDGAALFHHAAALDAIAEEHGLPPLSSFADDREPPPDFDGYPEELAEAIGPWTAWFSPTDGLRCVEGLIAALADPRTRARVTPVEMVLADLDALQDVLVIAKQKKARFRLELA
jgi:transglutaminase-like putative cysteine protease